MIRPGPACPVISPTPGSGFAGILPLASVAATSTSSVSSSTHTAPFWRSTARPVFQDVAREPVWDWANSETSFCPTINATTGFRSDARRRAAAVPGPSATVSMCSAMTEVQGSSAR